MSGTTIAPPDTNPRERDPLPRVPRFQVRQVLRSHHQMQDQGFPVGLDDQLTHLESLFPYFDREVLRMILQGQESHELAVVESLRRRGSNEIACPTHEDSIYGSPDVGQAMCPSYETITRASPRAFRPEPTLHGWMWKCVGLFGSWERRYVIMGQNALHVFYTEVSESDAEKIAGWNWSPERIHTTNEVRKYGRAKFVLLQSAQTELFFAYGDPVTYDADGYGDQFVHPFTLTHLIRCTRCQNQHGCTQCQKSQTMGGSSPASLAQWVGMIHKTRRRLALLAKHGQPLHEPDPDDGRSLLAGLVPQGAPPTTPSAELNTAECAICFESLHTEPVGVLCTLHGARVCRHIFHKKCLGCMTKRTCPICRHGYDGMCAVPDIGADPQKWFKLCDTGGNGGLSQRDVGEMLQAQLPVDPDRFDEELPELFRAWDVDGKGHISYDAMMRPGKGLQSYVRNLNPSKAQAPSITEADPGSVDSRGRSWLPSFFSR
jgi:hypothetical protein